jgi:peptidoglycan-associated lipoprotein
VKLRILIQLTFRGTFSMKQWHNLLLLTIFVLAGCASKGDTKPFAATATTSTRTPPPIFRPVDSLHSSGVSEETTDAKEEVSEAPSKRIIYFDYDQNDVKTDYYEVLQEHAAYLSEHPDISIRLEGHADERGSREYNLALGEERTTSTQEIFITLGIFENQLETLSYGEEQPAVIGHNEGSWWQNRRVELVYP